MRISWLLLVIVLATYADSKRVESNFLSAKVSSTEERLLACNDEIYQWIGVADAKNTIDSLSADQLIKRMRDNNTLYAE